MVNGPSVQPTLKHYSFNVENSGSGTPIKTIIVKEADMNLTFKKIFIKNKLYRNEKNEINNIITNEAITIFFLMMNN